jgi:hypothetical protein
VKSFLLAASTAVMLLIAGCGNQGSPASAPDNFRVVAGDGSVTATWTEEPDVDYWIFYGPGSAITTSNWATSGGSVITGAKSPRIITGLANDRTYSFTINGRKDRGPGGDGAPTQVAVPRLAGANWAAGTPLGTGKLNSIVAGGSSLGFAVVTVGAGGTIDSAIGSVPMTARTNPAAPLDLNAITYGPAGFVAAGANGTVLSSLDATTWTAQTSGTTAAIFGGAASFGTYVLVGSGGALLTSGNATSWNTINSGFTTDLYAAAYGAGRYVIVGAGGTIAMSTEAVTWNPSAIVTTNDLRGVAYGAVASADGTTTTNAYVAVGKGGTVLMSTDAQTWALVPSFTTADLYGVVNGGRFVAVGAGGAIFTSLDGITWESRVSGTTEDLTSAARQLSGYTAVGDKGVNVSTF